MDEDNKPTAATTVISIRADTKLKEQIAEESALRGHTVSEAAEKMLRLGMPRYLKQVPKKFERVETAA